MFQHCLIRLLYTAPHGPQPGIPRLSNGGQKMIKILSGEPLKGLDSRSRRNCSTIRSDRRLMDSEAEEDASELNDIVGWVQKRGWVRKRGSKEKNIYIANHMTKLGAWHLRIAQRLESWIFASSSCRPSY